MKDYSNKVPTKDQEILVTCKDGFAIYGSVNIQGFDRFSDFYDQATNLHVYDAVVWNAWSKEVKQSYICIEKQNILFAFPPEEQERYK